MARIRQTPRGPFRCTACKEYITTSFEAHLHPLLNVLICRDCLTSYGNGDFSQFPPDPESGEPGVDKFGDDNYCRWCVDGGELFACGGIMDDASNPNRCHYAFCQSCIMRNVPDDPIVDLDSLSEEEKSNFRWVCYACDDSRLKDLRQSAQEAIQALSQRDLVRGSNANGPGGASVVVNSTSETAPSSAKKRRTESVENVPDVAKADETDRSKSAGKSSSKTTGKEAERERPRESDRPRRRENADRDGAKESGRDPPRDSDRLRSKDAGRERSRSKEKEQRKDAEKESSKDGAKDNRKEPEKERPKDQEKDRTKDQERDRIKDQEKERPKEPEKERARDKDKSKDPHAKEPEASLMPPLEKPRQAVTSLRKLAKAGNDTFKTPRISTASSSSSTIKKPPEAPQGPLSDVHLQRAKTTSDEASRISKPLQFKSSLVHKPKPLSKQLKQSNEQINPSTKVVLTEAELKRKLEMFEKVKQTCITEIGNKFQTVLEMFQAKELENKSILKYEIEDLERPLQEFHTMLRDLMSLYNSQT